MRRAAVLAAVLASVPAIVPPSPSSCWREGDLTDASVLASSGESLTATDRAGGGGAGGAGDVTPQQILFRSGDCVGPEQKPSVCFRIPSLLAAGNKTLLAFAKAMNYSGDQCYPRPYYCGVGCGPGPTASRPPAPGDNTSSIVLRRSTDAGSTWSGITEVARGVDFEAVYDAVTGAVLVQYAGDSGIVPQPNNADVGSWQATSSDLGRTWSKPESLAYVLGKNYSGALVGPGRGLQLRHAASPHKGRLLWCGHLDALGPSSPGRIVPIWASDDNGKSYKLTAVMPHDNTGKPKCGPGGCPGGLQWGPDECQMAEMANGDVRFEARNNFAPQTGEKARMVSVSTTGGDSWGPITFDADLNNAMDTQASLLRDPTSGALFASGPVLVHCSGSSCNGRVNMTVSRSDDPAGNQWSKSLLIHGSSANSSGGGGYSCLTDIPQRPDVLGLLYEREHGADCWYGSSCLMAFVRFPSDLHAPPPPPPPPPPPQTNSSLHSYSGAIGVVVNPERGYRMGLYEFPNLNTLEGTSWDNSPLLHGQNVTVTLTMIALNEYSRPFRPISADYLAKLQAGFAALRKLHVKALVNVYCKC